MGDLPTEVHWSGQSNTFALPGQDPDEVRDLTVLGFADGIESRFGLGNGSRADVAASLRELWHRSRLRGW